MSLADAVRSWLQGEEHVRSIPELCGGKLADELDELLEKLKAPGGSRRRKIAATRRLQELTKAAAANAGGRYPVPHVWPHEWMWGQPGSVEDREMLGREVGGR